MTGYARMRTLPDRIPPGGVPNLPDVIKNLIALGLLIVLLAPPLLVGGWFQLERAQLRREVRARMLSGVEPGELVLLTFSQEEALRVLRWERDDEFEFNGQMYDVARIETEGDTVRYWCWPDGPETRLNQELEALTAQLFHETPEPGQQTARLLYFFKSLYFSESQAWQAVCTYASVLFQPYREEGYLPPVLAIALSPPRLG